MEPLLNLAFYQKALTAAVLMGIGCSIIGVWVVLMRISFVGVCISHAAFAGGLLGLLLRQPVTPWAFLFSLSAAGILGPLSDRGRLSLDASLGILFSGTLGLAFLFLGRISSARSAALNLLWGNILTLRTADVCMLAAAAILVLGTLLLFYKEIQSLLFSRELAKASGIPATLLFYGLLCLCGIVITASLRAAGGLLVFSLIVNPAAAACQISYDLRKVYVLSALFGTASGVSGLAIAGLFDLPAGASIVLASSAIFLLALLFSPKRYHGRHAERVL